MKKPELKLKMPQINLSRKMPYILVAVFMIVGVSLVVFGYFLINRQPGSKVQLSVQEDIDSLSLKFSEDKINQLFQSNYDTTSIENPGFKTKNPFLNF